MRIREASYRGTNDGGIWACLEVWDVLHAIGSVRRMSGGWGMEEAGGRVSSRGEGRKWSIRDEIEGEDRKRPRLDDDYGENGEKDVLACILDGDGDEHIPTSPLVSLPPLSAYLPLSPITPTPLFPERVLPPVLPRLQIPATPLFTRDALLEASQKATHETNLRRRDLEAAERAVIEARAKYDHARILAERLRGKIKRAERERVWS
jgi:hypothetical protein